MLLHQMKRTADLKIKKSLKQTKYTNTLFVFAAPVHTNILSDNQKTTNVNLDFFSASYFKDLSLYTS